MPLSALPEHLRDIENHFPDDDQYGTSWFGRLYRWYQKKTKTWFAFSYRCTEWWAKWRKYPKVLFAICDINSTFRFEDERGEELDTRWRRVIINENVEIWRPDMTPSGIPVWDVSPAYLSRIQYLARWYFAVQWPLMISFQIRPFGGLIFGYWGHFDADLIYWMITSIFLGRNFK